MEKKELNVIEVPASGRKNWSGGAYTIAFLYTKNNGNLIVKGYYDEVKDYIKNNYTHYFVNFTLWSNKQFRDIWYFWLSNYYIAEPDRKKIKGRKPRYKWVVRKFFSNDVENKLQFRRFPKRWIKEFDNLD